ncbi:MAG: SusC/RagA family TonB-linked outer membrane protein [Puia sp.]|nr:SusC/RagA family TonB-linked outer membrane protein [Puia sp.]
MQVSAAGYGQVYSLRLTNAPLEKAIKTIQTNTGYNFYYLPDDLDGSHPVTVQMQSVDIREILDVVFKDQPVTFKIDGAQKTILVTRKTAAPAPSAPVAVNQDIRGKVVNEKGEPERGVSVYLRGASTGVETNEKGEFEIHDIPDNAMLVFSHVGYEVQEYLVKGNHDILIKLRVAAQKLADMEVTVSNGIFSLPRERATGSYDYIDNELINRSVSTDILSRLNGVASGVLFDNTAGNSINMQIRGMSTIQSNTQPLIVLNDMPYDGNLEDINPNDIESITVLKDAAAASIWGVRAGNGVVVITTKRGHFKQPLNIEVNSNYTTFARPNLFYDPNFLDANDFINLEQQLYSAGFYTRQISSTRMPPISPVVMLLDSAAKGLVSQSYATNQINGYRNLDVRNDLSRYFYRPQGNQQYSLSLSGGTDKMNYLVSGGYDKNNAMKVGSNYQRITLNSLSTFAPVKGLSITASLNYNQGITNADNTLSQISTNGIFGLYGMNPYLMLADKNGNALPYLKDFSTNMVENITPAQGFQNWQFFPLTELQNGYNTTTTREDDVRGYLGLKYIFLKSFTIEGKYQYEETNTNGLTNETAQSYAARSLINDFSIQDPTTGMVTGYNVPIGGILSYAAKNLESQNFRAQLSYNNSWHDHNVSFVGGYDVRDIVIKTNNFSLYGYDPSSSSFGLVNYATAYSNDYFSGSVNPGLGVNESINRYRSYFSNLGYTYLGRYTLSGSARIDQSNLFGVNTNQKTVPLWSAGAKWDVDKEPFFKSDWIDLLRVRATYGYSGNVNNSIYAYPTAIYTTYSTPYGSTTAASLSSPGDPDLTWEKSAMVNGGVDFGVLRNRLSGSIDYYRRKGTNLIGTEPIQASAGVTNVTGNYSDMSGNGVDLKLNAAVLTGKFKWNAEFLASYTANKVTKYLGQAIGTNYNIVVGKPVSGLYGLKWAGLDPQNGNPRGYIDDTISEAYSAIYSQPLTGTAGKFATTSSWVYKGPAQPTYFGGFRNTFSYADLSLSFNITFKAGYDFTRSTIDYSALIRNWEGNRDYVDRWQKPGDEKKTNIPSLPSLTSIDNTRDIFFQKAAVLIDNASQIRFQDINLSYNVKNHFLKKVSSVKAITVYAYMNNVGLLWRANKDHLDPDFPTGIPNPRSISFGAKFGF